MFCKSAPFDKLRLRVLPAQIQRNSIVDDGQIHRRRYRLGVEPAVADLRLAIDSRIIRQLSGDLDRTTGRIAPVQRTLRPFEHLDLLHALEILQLGGQRRGIVNIIHVDADRRRLGDDNIGRLLASHTYVATHRIVRRRLEAQAGCLRGEVLDVDNAMVCQVVAREGRDCNGRLLNIFGAFARRNHDLLQPAGVGLRIRIRRGAVGR
jgi:hypothetical protein